jgi:hypothetical protein
LRRARFRDEETWRAGRNGPALGATILARSPVARIAIAVAMLFACAGDPAQNPAWQLAGHPGLLFPIKVYYERNALEENGRCTAPLLEGVSRSEVLADDQDQLVVALTYRYRDRIRDEPRAPSGALPWIRECEGFASRTFTIAKSEQGLTVVGMDGPQKGRRLPAPTLRQ